MFTINMVPKIKQYFFQQSCDEKYSLTFTFIIHVINEAKTKPKYPLKTRTMMEYFHQ